MLEQEAYKALNAKNLPGAETRFKAILAADPKEAQALAGMVTFASNNPITMEPSASSNKPNTTVPRTQILTLPSRLPTSTSL